MSKWCHEWFPERVTVELHTVNIYSIIRTRVVSVEPLYVGWLIATESRVYMLVSRALVCVGGSDL